MRWIVVLVVVVGCGKSAKKNDPPPPVTPGDAAPVATAADATPAPVDAAAAAAAGLVLPAGAVCSGRWTAKLELEGGNTCKDDQLAPYLDVDFTITASPTGWTATVARPEGFTVASIRVGWETTDSVGCHASVTLQKPSVEIGVEVSRTDLNLPATARIDIGEGTAACMGSVRGPATVEPDGGAVPPPDPALVAVAGTYQLDLALPAKYKCDIPKVRIDPKQTLEVSIDRANGDPLVMTGLTWKPGEVTQHEGVLSVSATNEEDSDTDLWLRLKVDGAQVTGTASTRAAHADVEPECPYFEAKVTGTRTPK